jgi:hypothetical protein
MTGKIQGFYGLGFTTAPFGGRIYENALTGVLDDEEGPGAVSL